MAFALTPATFPPAAADQFPLGPSFADEGVDLGDGVRTLNIVGDPSTVSVTRGVGENSHIITIELLSVPPPEITFTFLETFTGSAGTLVGHEVDSPTGEGLTWQAGGGNDLRLTGSGTAAEIAENPGALSFLSPNAPIDWTLPVRITWDLVLPAQSNAEAADSTAILYVEGPNGYAEVQVHDRYLGTHGVDTVFFVDSVIHNDSVSTVIGGTHQVIVNITATGATVSLDGNVISTFTFDLSGFTSFVYLELSASSPNTDIRFDRILIEAPV